MKPKEQIQPVFGKKESYSPLIRRTSIERDKQFISDNKKELGKAKTINGLKLWEVICTNCQNRLALFYSKSGKLDKDVEGFTLYHVQDKQGTRGCFGLNVNDKTGEYNFECTCGNKEIEESRTTKIQIGKEVIEKKNYKRYTKYATKLLK